MYQFQIRFLPTTFYYEYVLQVPTQNTYTE